MHDAGFGCILVASPSLVKRARWQEDPPTHQGPVLPGACAKEKKNYERKREKRERLLVSPASAASLQARSSRTRNGAPGRWGQWMDKGRKEGSWGEPGCLAVAWGVVLSRRRQGRVCRVFCLPGSLHSCAKPKIASVNLQQFEWPWTGDPAHRLTEIQLNFTPSSAVASQQGPGSPVQEVCVSV